GAVRPRREAELDPFREQFAEMFARLRREHGVTSYLAHNMTVTPSNLDEVSEVTRSVLGMSFDMMSFQPAAFIGDDRRWKEDFDDVSIDDVWERIEEGAGQQLPWTATQFGDPRCNRTTVGAWVGNRFAPLLDPDDAKDLAARDRFLNHFGGMIFGGTPRPILAIKVVRALLRHPGDVAPLLGLFSRVILRAGGLRAVLRAMRNGTLSFKTFVVHNFMDAAQVKPAWDLMERGLSSDDPLIRETQERLGSCMYAMSHPEDGRLVPACVQHSVLDPAENEGLRRLLPLADRSTTVVSRPSGLTPLRPTGIRAAHGA
ncbi:MAG TPA: hypothetical protein PKI99_06435, partial [Terrimesophilobacter sp.]|nr:hypothetical protein [Terrimesophilobacter sp.]